MHEILVPLTNYLLFLGAGAVFTLIALTFWRDWRRVADPEPAPAADPGRRPPYCQLGYVLVDDQYAAAFLRDNPEMMTADQCKRVLVSFAEDKAPWLALFNSLLSRATLSDPGKAPLFYLRRWNT